MSQDKLLAVLEKVLWVCCGLMILSLISIPAGMITLVQGTGGVGAPGVPPAFSVLIRPFGMVPLLFLRHAVWLGIYWQGARVLGALRREREGGVSILKVTTALRWVKRLLVASCMLDFLLLPQQLMRFGFEIGRGPLLLGALSQTSQFLVPNTYGVISLILAALVHHYGQLLEERARMQEELQLTI